MSRLSSPLATNVFAVLVLAVTVVHSYSFRFNPIRANNDLEPNFLRLRRNFEQEPLCMAAVIRAHCDERRTPDNEDQLECRVAHCERCLAENEGVLFEVDTTAPHCRRLASCACYLNDSDRPELRTAERLRCRAIMREICPWQ